MSRAGTADDRRLAAPATAAVLRVSDVGRSREFYTRLLGAAFVEWRGDSPGLPRLVLAACPGSRAPQILLVSCSSPVGACRLSIEVESAGEVLDLYLLALMLEADGARLDVRANLPVFSIRDPDGHLIEVRARCPCAPRATPGRRDEARSGGRRPASSRRGAAEACRHRPLIAGRTIP